MRFFLPHWDDKVHTKFDFINDAPINNSSNSDDNYSYIWDIYGKNRTPIDGLLISKANLITKKGNYNKVAKGMKEYGLREFLHFPKTLPIMADCGAFSYIEEKEPPYDPLETLDFYYKMKFNLGVAVDHLIIPKTFDQKDYRSEITLRNAQIMFDEWSAVKKYYQTFKLIGVIQGWDLDSYKENAQKLLDMGYDYIAIGGVALAPNSVLIPIIESVASVIRNHSLTNNKKIDLHILGVGRASLFRTYLKNNVASFDTAAYLRQAWLAEKKGYQLNFDEYMVVRVRQNFDFVKELRMLEQLRKYSNNEMTIEEIVNSLLKNKDFTDMNNRMKNYQETLESFCWKECKCTICKDIDIDVIIFRGNNRNRRRGFHNIWNFYFKKFRKYIPFINFIFYTDKIYSTNFDDKIPRKILDVLKRYPIEIFITDSDKTYHLLENKQVLCNSYYLSHIENSDYIISNRKLTKKTLVYKNEKGLQKVLHELFQKVISVLIEPENLKLLENKDNNQQELSSFLTSEKK